MRAPLFILWSRSGAGSAAALALAVFTAGFAFIPTPAAAQTLSREEARKQAGEISVRSKAEQAECRKQSGAERQKCINLAQSRERRERAELEARARPQAAAGTIHGNIRDGRASIAPGQYGHVASDGSTVIGNRQALPAGSAGAVRSAEQLNKGTLPSNRPVDVKEASRAVQGARP